MKFKSVIQKNLQTQPTFYRLFDKQSKNPLRYSLDMAGHEIVGEAYRLDREGYYTYLLNYTVRGSATMEYNGQTFPLAAGDLTLIDCNRPHKFSSNAEGWEFYFLHCDGPALHELYELFQQTTGFVLHGYDEKKLLEHLGTIFTILEEHGELSVPEPVEIDEGVFTRLSEQVYAILNDLWLQIHNRSRSEMPPNIAKAREYVCKNFTNRITLEEVASVAFLSPWRLAHQFKRYTGRTVVEMITELRLRRATELLQTTNKKIIDIAVECGYSDTQMLNKIFKQNFSMTPKQYRDASLPRI